MDAVFDVNVDRSVTIADEFAKVLGAFEHATGLEACFRPLTDRWRDSGGVPIAREPFVEHRSGFCDAVKARAFAACVKCDHGELPGACSRADRRVVEPFVRTCHAGADEILLPIWSEGVLVAVLFLGQFARGSHRTSAAHPLPQLADSDVQRARALMVMMRSYLEDLLRRLEHDRTASTMGRRGAIEAYVREQLVAGPTLAELASRLCLSPSRTSHVVREETGRSFQDLVEERRIALAKDLLVGTDGTIAWVARQAGFQDVAYFCRYFKKRTSTTPTSFRRRYREITSV